VFEIAGFTCDTPAGQDRVIVTEGQLGTDPAEILAIGVSAC
jgi:hypothetical protein